MATCTSVEPWWNCACFFGGSNLQEQLGAREAQPGGPEQARQRGARAAVQAAAAQAQEAVRAERARAQQRRPVVLGRARGRAGALCVRKSTTTHEQFYDFYIVLTSGSAQVRRCQLS